MEYKNGMLYLDEIGIIKGTDISNFIIDGKTVIMSMVDGVVPMNIKKSFETVEEADKAVKEIFDTIQKGIEEQKKEVRELKGVVTPPKEKEEEKEPKEESKESVEIKGAAKI